VISAVPVRELEIIFIGRSTTHGPRSTPMRSAVACL
jgi:hypothetical protein